jgi:hypothetical protein
MKKHIPVCLPSKINLAGYLLEPDYMFLVAAMFFVLSK